LISVNADNQVNGICHWILSKWSGLFGISTPVNSTATEHLLEDFVNTLMKVNNVMLCAS
jgi:hypothetical protein